MYQKVSTAQKKSMHAREKAKTEEAAAKQAVLTEKEAFARARKAVTKNLDTDTVG